MINNKKKIIVISVIIILIIIMSIISYFLFSNNNEEKNILLYKNSDNELKYIIGNKKTVLLSKSFDENINVKAYKDEFIYEKNDDIYLVNINNNKNEKIGINVKFFDFLGNDIIYLDNDNILYLYSNNNKEKVEIDVMEILYYSSNIIIYNKDSNLYYYNIKTKEKQIITRNYETNRYINVDKSLTKILFLDSSNVLYKYNMESKSLETLATDIDNILSVSDNLEKIIYSIKTKEVKYYDLIINDTKKQIDKNSPTKCHYYYDSNYNTYYYYDENWIIHIVSKEEYDLCNKNANGITLRNDIRNDKKSVNYYDIYLLNGSEKEKVVEGINEILYSDVNKNLVYKKYIISDKEKVDISKLNTMDEYLNIIKEIKYTLYYIGDNINEEAIDKFNKDVSDIKIINNAIYYTYEENDKKILNKYDIPTKENVNVGKNVILFDYDTLYYDMIFLDNYENQVGDLVVINKNGIQNIDNDVTKNIVIYKNYLYYYQNMNFEYYNGDFVMYAIDKDTKKTIENISFVVPATSEEFYVFKDYSKSSDSTSLYYYKNNKLSPIEYNVNEFNIIKR